MKGNAENGFWKFAIAVEAWSREAGVRWFQAKRGRILRNELCMPTAESCTSSS
jgi:hypothetical protein